MRTTARFALPAGLKIQHLTSHPDWPETPEHRHDFHELIVLLRGPYRVALSEKTERIEQGEAIYYPAGVMHRPEFERDHGAEMLVTNWYRPDLGITQAVKLSDPSGYLSFLTQWAFEATEREQYSTESILRANALLSYLKDLLYRRPESRIEHALQHVAINLHLGTGVAEMAKAVGISRSQLYRDLRKERGRTPRAVLLQLRMEQARALLVNTNMSVKEIAQRVGYRNPNHLTNQLRKYYGKAPKALRAQHRNWNV